MVDPKDVTPGYWLVRWPNGGEEIVKVGDWFGDIAYQTFGNDYLPIAVVREPDPDDDDLPAENDNDPTWLQKIRTTPKGEAHGS